MKLLIEKATGIVKYIFNDSDEVVIGEKITITPNFNIADMNSSNAELVDNGELPEDYIGNKYIYNTETKEFTLNPDYVEPAEEK